MDSEKQEECNHNFVFSSIQLESNENDIIYHQVAYSVCKKCGEIKKTYL